MSAHKRRLRWLRVEPVETIRPFRPGPPSRSGRLAELMFFRDENRRAITDPDPPGGYRPPSGKGKERTCIDGIWGPWTHFTYGPPESPEGALP